MSYEFTKLSEVPAVSEFPEGANAIIETNGEIKRCPSSGGSSVPKPLTYDYMPEGYPKKSVLFNIEWDGNTDGLPSAIINSNITFYKVSDMVPTNDELTGGTFIPPGGVEVISITSDMITTLSVDLRIVSEYIVIVQKENATFGNTLFPQTGTYFYKGTNTGNYITRLSKQTVTPMAEEFLPTNMKNNTAKRISKTNAHFGGGAGARVVTFTYTRTSFSADKTVEEVTTAMASMPVIGNLIVSTGETPVTVHLGACCSEIYTSETPTPAFGPFIYNTEQQKVLGLIGVNSSGQWEARLGS